MLLEKIGSKYYIKGESDLDTDANRNVSLSFLGEEKAKPKLLTYILFATGFIAIFYCIYIFRFRKKKGQIQKHSSSVTTQPSSSYSTNTIISDLKEAVLKEIKTELPSLNSDEFKGLAFEKFVVSKFNQTFFRVLEWRGDKEHNGVYAESSKHPDLELKYEYGGISCHFSVECKWRKGFSKGKIKWAKDYQLKNYRQFQITKKLPVFIVMGIGGEPSNPSELYVIPLDAIKSEYLYENAISQYKKYSKEFFLHTRSMNLT